MIGGIYTSPIKLLMKKIDINKLLLPIGLLLMPLTFIIKHFVEVPDFADGLFKGVAIGVLILALLNQNKMKRAR